MSPSDMPDYENMSPEELMRWMESLAKRQGANAEELMTDADAELSDIDESTVVLDEPGYIPYGQEMTQEQKAAAKQRKIDAEKRAAERKAAEEAAAAAPPPPPPPPPAPAPAPPPAPAAQPAAMDVDNMSPEELMRWMESLAKRQGVKDEELLTSADATIADVDPDSVIDEPGYVPFGEKAPEKPAAPKTEAPPPAPKPTAPPPPPAPAPAPVDILSDLTAPVENDLNWLQGITGNTGSSDIDLPGLDDLDALTADLESALGDPAPTQSSNPIAWLEGLASTQPKPEAPTPPSPPPAPSADVTNPLDAGVDPMQWLESLAKNQGAKDEELITGGGLNVQPPTGMPAGTADNYEPYNVDDEGESEPASSIDPQNWLEELAANDDSDIGADLFAGFGQEDEVLDASDPRAWLGAQADDPAVQAQVPRFDPNPPSSAGKPPSADPVVDALNRGENVDPAAMERWLAGKMDELLEKNREPLPLPDAEEDIDEPLFDPNAPAVAGDMPDWLQNMAPQEDAPAAANDLSALGITPPSELFTETPPPAAQAGPDDMPDWLSMADDSASSDLGDIFGSDSSVLTQEIAAPPDVPDMPDWLREDIPDEGESLADIFEMVDDPEPLELEAPAVSAGPADAELIDRFRPQEGMEQDPWVSAIDEEQSYLYEEGDTLPDWYVSALNDPSRQVIVDGVQADNLAPANLPAEQTLAPGEPERIPAWFAAATNAAAMSEAIPSDELDMPDWLQETETSSADAGLPDWLADTGITAPADESIPDWLKETLPEPNPPSPAANVLAAPPAPAAPEPPPLVVEQPASAPVPAAPPAAVQRHDIDVGKLLTEARMMQENGNVETALQYYEQVIRVNSRLETVVSSVERIIKADKENAAAHRILGDALMRQGKLQAALDTYRKALNLL